MYKLIALVVLAAILGFLTLFFSFRAKQAKGTHWINDVQADIGDGDFMTSVKSKIMLFVWSVLSLLALLGAIFAGLSAFLALKNVLPPDIAKPDSLPASAVTDNPISEPIKLVENEQKVPSLETAGEQASLTSVREPDPKVVQSADDASDSSELERITAQIDQASIVPTETGDSFNFKSTSGQSFYANSKTTLKEAAALLVLKSKKDNTEVCLTVSPQSDSNSVFEVENATQGSCN